MPSSDRLNQIARLIDDRGYLSVTELSRVFDVSEMTIRRDLTELDRQKRIQRTFGGAVSFHASVPEDKERGLTLQQATSLAERLDGLIATALNPKYDGLLLEAVSSKRSIPIIAESLSIGSEATVVALDNYQAGFDLGCWAGKHAREHWNGTATVLDLTYYLANTLQRSRGFLDGLHANAGSLDVVLQLDAQSRFETAYQLTRDALVVHPQINTIFTINDITAAGAIRACKELDIDPRDLAIFTFGLEGNSMKNALATGDYCQAGLAMFPEIVGPVCVEAAILAYNHLPLPAWLTTPHLVLDRRNLYEVYQDTADGWAIRWENVRGILPIPLDIFHDPANLPQRAPNRIGLIVPFSEHEWYQSLSKIMRAYAEKFAIDFEIIDVYQSLKDEVEVRRREIANLAARDIQPGEVIMVDGGPIGGYLAEILVNKGPITVITNAIPIFEILRANPENTLMLTGGVHRQSSQTLVGPTAENALRELRADKLFLSAAGISLSFGLSHTHVSEVTMKQAMLRSARQIILLADHTNFGQESVVQIAPLSVVNKIITDDALPASTRLELTKLGIEIELAAT